MGLMLATIWIRLGTGTDKLNDRLSVLSVHSYPACGGHCLTTLMHYSFFSVAFLGFMSVAGIPAFLEVNIHCTRTFVLSPINTDRNEVYLFVNAPMGCMALVHMS